MAVGRALAWKIAGGAGFALLCAAIFAAYQRPEMLAAFGELMAFCAALVR